MIHVFPSRRSSDLIRLGGRCVGWRALSRKKLACSVRAMTMKQCSIPSCGSMIVMCSLICNVEMTLDSGMQIGKSKSEGRILCHCWLRSEEHTSELQSLMRNSYADFCLEKNK